jgi:hypothetical protein
MVRLKFDVCGVFFSFLLHRVGFVCVCVCSLCTWSSVQAYIFYRTHFDADLLSDPHPENAVAHRDVDSPDDAHTYLPVATAADQRDQQKFAGYESYGGGGVGAMIQTKSKSGSGGVMAMGVSGDGRHYSMGEGFQDDEEELR